MRLSPIDIAHRSFTINRSGYSPAEVEEFLVQVATDYERVLSSTSQLQDKLDAIEREVERYRAMETTLRDALVVAQISANETRSLAQREADSLLRDAMRRSDHILEDAIHSAETLRHERLRIGLEFRAMLQTQLHCLQAELDRITIPVSAEAGDNARDQQSQMSESKPAIESHHAVVLTTSLQQEASSLGTEPDSAQASGGDGTLDLRTTKPQNVAQ